MAEVHTVTQIEHGGRGHEDGQRPPCRGGCLHQIQQHDGRKRGAHEKWHRGQQIVFHALILCAKLAKSLGFPIKKSP